MERAFKKQALFAVEKTRNSKEKLSVDKKILPLILKDIDVMKVEDEFEIILENEVYTDDNMAIEKLAELMKLTESKVIGSVYNMPIKIDVTLLNGQPNRSIYVGTHFKEKLEWRVYPKALLASLKDVNIAFTKRKEKLTSEISYLEKELDALSKNYRTEFEYKEKLNQLILDKANIEAELSLNN